MGSPALKIPAGLTAIDDPNFDPFKPVQIGATGLPEGLVEVPPPALSEDNYFKQVKDRVSTMASSMYDAWKAGDFDAMTAIPAAIKGLNKQYYETLPQSKTTSEFLTNLIPMFGPILNNAAKKWAAGQPQGSAAELTTDVLLPLLAEKIPGALKELVPERMKPGLSAAGQEAAKGLYSSALKPVISGKPGIIAKTERALTTGLEEAIPVSRGGAKTLLQGIDEMRDAVQARVEAAPEPRLVFTPKTPQPALPPGPVDFELGPTVPPPGTTQTVLSHAEQRLSQFPLKPGKPTQVQFGPFEGLPSAEERIGVPATREPGLRPTYTEASATPGQTAAKLNQAQNAQLIADINQRAKSSGLLDAVQEAARRADQPVPYDISEVFNMSAQNAIDPVKVAARLDQLKRRFRTTNPEADFAAIDASKEEFLRNYPNPLSYKQAQALKVNTGNILSERAFGEQKTARIEAEKTLRRGLKEELENDIPEIKYLNAREGDQIGLRPALLRAVQRVRNWDVIGLSTPLMAAAGAAIGTAVPTLGTARGAEVAAVVALALRDPWVKSKLAIAINRAAKLDPVKFGAPSISAAEARINAYHAAIERAAAGVLPAQLEQGANPPWSPDLQ
jgi:hypothetical protein